LESAFREYDKDGSGMLDFNEFNKVATRMGFGTSAHCIFKSLDHDNSGEISYMELIESFNTAPPKNTEVKQLCTSLMFAFQEEGSSTACAAKLNTSGWVIKGRDVETIRRELQALLRDSGAHVGDVMALFDQDQHGKQEIDDMEFSKAMREHCGYRGPVGLLLQTFKSLDTDGSGTIGFDELFEFIRGRRHSLDKRAKPKEVMRLQPPEGAEYSLDELVWDCETLRILMMQMLERCNANPSDLLVQFQFSKSTDGVLDKREFISMVRSMLSGHERLWESTVRAVAHEAFDDIDIKARSLIPGTLDLVEISRWLAAPTSRPKHLELPTQPKTAQSPPKKQQGCGQQGQLKPGQLKSGPVQSAAGTCQQPAGKAVEHKAVEHRAVELKGERLPSARASSSRGLGSDEPRSPHSSRSTSISSSSDEQKATGRTPTTIEAMRHSKAGGRWVRADAGCSTGVGASAGPELTPPFTSGRDYPAWQPSQASSSQGEDAPASPPSAAATLEEILELRRSPLAKPEPTLVSSTIEHAYLSHLHRYPLPVMRKRGQPPRERRPLSARPISANLGPSRPISAHLSPSRPISARSPQKPPLSAQLHDRPLSDPAHAVEAPWPHGPMAPGPAQPRPTTTAGSSLVGSRVSSATSQSKRSSSLSWGSQLSQSSQLTVDSSYRDLARRTSRQVHHVWPCLVRPLIVELDTVLKLPCHLLPVSVVAIPAAQRYGRGSTSL